MVATYVDEKRTIGSRVLCQKNKWKSFLDNAIEAKSKKGVLKFFGCAVIVFHQSLAENSTLEVSQPRMRPSANNRL